MAETRRPLARRTSRTFGAYRGAFPQGIMSGPQLLSQHRGLQVRLGIVVPPAAEPSPPFSVTLSLSKGFVIIVISLLS
jgi:hypothetical protein